MVQQAVDAYTQTVHILSALKKMGLPVVWLEPNSDAGSADILRALTERGLPAGSHRIKHMDRALFGAAMKHCAVMIGNSSAGIIEAASLGTPVVNVGDRQKLRERNTNVKDATTDVASIHQAIENALASGKVPCDNRYGDGHAGPRIASYLTTLSLDRTVLDKCNTY